MEWNSYAGEIGRQVLSTLDSRWQEVTRCPGCCCTEMRPHGQLPGSEYYFGDERIAFPEGGVCVVECLRCGLFFKNVLPSLELLVEVFSRQADNAWSETFALCHEREFIESHVGRIEFDLLDVGPSNGALLHRFSDLPGRRSGLDVVRNPGLNIGSGSEFIEGLIDNEQLVWSREPYDVITLFDVIEHFYRPDLAFANLRKMLKKGAVLVLETGNVESWEPVNHGAGSWWYANLFEHHVFWSPASIRYYAGVFGFEITYMQKVRHKSLAYRSILDKLKRLVKFFVWKIAPKLYMTMANKLHLWSNRYPLSSASVDHIRVVMKKS